MRIIGLTGSIGMGKSTAAEHFRARGIPVFDADAAVHALYRGRAVPIIEAAFPGSTTDGEVDRGALSKALGGDREKIKHLESLVHPLVREEREAFVAKHKSDGAASVVFEVPLLFETGGDEACDITIIMSAPAAVQEERVLARPGMTREKFKALLANQMPDAEKRARADYVVDTSGTIEQTRAQLDTIIESLKLA